MLISEEVIAVTTQRFQARENRRSATVDKIEHIRAHDGNLLEVDDPTYVRLRADHLSHQPSVRTALSSNSTGDIVEPIALQDSDLLERIIDMGDRFSIAYLETGMAVARSVGRIHIRNQFAPLGFATGFLISPRLVMTNNHILPDPQTARTSRIEFDYQKDFGIGPLQGQVFEFEPDTLFLTNVKLDCTVVAVQRQSIPQSGVSPVPLHFFGFNPLTAHPGKILLGESISIIHYPENQEKMVSLRQNELVDRVDDFVHYHTTTAPGSSGSPLYNNQWEVFGMHHSGLPARNEAGQILTQSGTVWTPERGEGSIQWVANEGVRMSSIHAWLHSVFQAFPESGKYLLDELLNPSWSWPCRCCY